MNKANLSDEEIREICIKQIKKLIKDKGTTRAKMAKELNISTKALDSYLNPNNNRNIHADTLYKIAVTYDVPLDYFYNAKSYLSKRDTMVDIVSSLDKVFRLAIRKNHLTQLTEWHLLIDRQFYNYLHKIQELERQYSSSDIFNYNDYNRKREEIHSEYKEYLKNIFDLDGFDEKQSVQKIIYLNYSEDEKNDIDIAIYNFENISVMDLIAKAPDNTKNGDTE